MLAGKARDELIGITAAACSDSVITTPTVPTKASAVVAAGTCQSELDAVRTAIDTASFTGKNADADEANLALKVTAAEAKLAEGKAADVIVKLEDVRGGDRAEHARRQGNLCSP
jgi:pectin methylesterase-like acyl-CoA thioesterase